MIENYRLCISPIHIDNVEISLTWQEFGIEYTNKNLMKYIKKPKDILVQCGTTDTKILVTMKLGIGTKRAMLSGGWALAAREFNLTKGRIYAFDFVPSKRYGLNLLIMPL